nr:hypothetical transcript [Hymenolepis microstoma]
MQLESEYYILLFDWRASKLVTLSDGLISIHPFNGLLFEWESPNLTRQLNLFDRKFAAYLFSNAALEYVLLQLPNLQDCPELLNSYKYSTTFPESEVDISIQVRKVIC